jgi:sigma-B regulation protein RsbU (phosphoserine phosphatase)
VARKIQFELIPQDHPEISNYEVTTYYQPAREVGGDYFDIIKSNDGKDITYLIIGDISGKGMAAALYMVRVQAIIHLLIGKFSKIKEIIINLKNYFSKNLRKEFFLTVVGAKIDSKGTINLCRAGHNPVLHFKKSSKSFDELNPNGIGIGFNDRGTFEKTIEEIKVKPEEGDILCFFTDGLTETMNIRKIQFGQDRLKRIISDNADKNVGEIKFQILREIEFFRGNAPQHDDLTMILLKSK